MNKISKEIITSKLQKIYNPHVVTIYLPTHRISTMQHLKEDQTRFKNVVRKAEVMLKEDNASDTVLSAFKSNSRALQKDINFWKHLTESLLIIAHETVFEVYHLPIDSDEYVCVDDKAHIAPLYGMLEELKTFHVLLVTQKNPLLYHGDLYGLDRMSVDLPVDIKTALQLDEMHIKSVQHHSGNGGNKAGQAMFHGHGGAKDAGYNERLAYFRLLDTAVAKNIRFKTPLILAGTESELADYRSISKIKSIMPNVIDGSFGPAEEQQISEKSRAIIRNDILHQQQNDIKDTESIVRKLPHMATDKLKEIFIATTQGRVKKLLVPMYQMTADTVRDNKDQVPKLSLATYNKSLGLLIQDVWNQDGKVVNVFCEQVPTRSPALAVYRY
jgi:hypothetical protein